ADGTVSVVEEPVYVEGAGAASVFEAATTNDKSIVRVAADRVVVAYRDSGNLGYLTAVVGTIAAVVVTWGTPVVAASVDATYVAAAYDSASDRVVVAYSDDATNVGRAVVGTVSGTSISFGSPTTFESAVSQYIAT